MDVASAPPHGRLEFTDEVNRSTLSRLAKRGDALRLASGIYAIGATLAPDQVALQHRFEIIGHVWPGSVLIGRTALAGGQPFDGLIHVAHPSPPRASRLDLPGYSIIPWTAPGHLPHDMELPAGIYQSGVARALVENVNVRGRPPRSRAGPEAVEDKIDDLARRGGAGRIRDILDQLDVIAPSFDQRQVEEVRRRLVAVLGTVTTPVRSPRLAARLAGQAFDAHRVAMLDAAVESWRSRAPALRSAAGPPERWSWEPFFEAYFSNFIEGTEFGVEEAVRIAVGGEVPVDRPADAHDIAATHRLTSDRERAAEVPGSADEFLDLLRDRHRTLMAARPKMQPGLFKDVPNFAGGYRFVEPDLVAGTLRQGFDRLAGVVDPMVRAQAMMLLVTECHPFADGNGRLARLMANAELSHAGQIRVIIPTSFRDNYLAALTAISSGNDTGQGLAAVMDFGQRWVSHIDWRGFDRAHDQIEARHGYLDPAEAESSGRRLRIPDQ